jgi:hypothetical protein
MRTIAITINKGGVGKTTLAKHLAVAAAAVGHNVMLLDMDTQQNSTSWGKRRNQQQGSPLPVVRFVTENDLPEELGRARGAGCDLVLIDTPPGRSSEAPAAVESASLVLIPFWLESDAFDGLACAGKRDAGRARSRKGRGHPGRTRTCTCVAPADPEGTQAHRRLLQPGRRGEIRGVAGETRPRQFAAHQSGNRRTLQEARSQARIRGRINASVMACGVRR